MKIADIEVKLIHHVGSDLDVVNAARVSFNKESEWSMGYPSNDDGRDLVLSERDAKLINYLAKHKHHSPFNHSFLSFRVKAPIFVARQLVKHKFMPFNEISRRYVTDEPEFYVPKKYRLKAENVKQGSSTDTTTEFYNPWGGVKCEINAVHIQHVDACFTLYQGLIDNGVCAEQARMVLPQNTMTEWRWSGTLNAFCDMLVLRLDKHTQAETREVAKLISQEIKSLFPVSHSALIGDLGATL